MFLTKNFQNAYHKIAARHIYYQDVSFSMLVICFYIDFAPCLFSLQECSSLSELRVDFCLLSPPVIHSLHTYFCSSFYQSLVSSPSSGHAPWGKCRVTWALECLRNQSSNLLCAPSAMLNISFWVFYLIVGMLHSW